jgi:ABC-type Zn uptake system ZnuABC Zn-binding protein ZnuA
LLRKPITALLLAALFVFPLAACGGQGATEQEGSSDGERLKVVATFSILGDLVENVGGEEIELTTLVGPNGDAHNFEPTPADSAKVADADLIFENGLEFETWLDDLYESSGSEAERVVVTDGVDLLTAEEEHEPVEEHPEDEHADQHPDDHGDEYANEEHTGDEHADEHGSGDHAAEDHTEDEHADEHGHEHGEYDPHVWMDPSRTVTMVENIRDALVEADPENAEAYERNAEEYIAELEELDAWILEQTDIVPEGNRKLITSHDTFGYYADVYGFEVVGTALPSFSTEASDPSAGEIAELVEEIEAAGVPAIFAENVTNPAVMEQVAAEAGVELAPPLYTDALGEPGSEGGTYLQMMRYNTGTITGALGG